MGGRHGRMAAAIQAGNGKGTKIGQRQDKVKETVVALEDWAMEFRETPVKEVVSCGAGGGTESH